MRGLRAETERLVRLYHYLIHKCLFYYYYEDTSTMEKQRCVQ